MNIRAAIGLVSCLLLLAACGHKDNTTNDPYKKDLTKRKLDNSNYAISLPKAYDIKLSREIDFDVYYFRPHDTTDKTSFRGGIYFGNAPGMFRADSAKCKVDTIHGEILGDVKTWTLYSCEKLYYVQIITNSKSSGNWNERTHVFGKAVTRSDLHKLMVVFSTIRKEK